MSVSQPAFPKKITDLLLTRKFNQHLKISNESLQHTMQKVTPKPRNTFKGIISDLLKIGRTKIISKEFQELSIKGTII
jgi:hypothetical protein